MNAPVRRAGARDLQSGFLAWRKRGLWFFFAAIALREVKLTVWLPIWRLRGDEREGETLLEKGE